jgi:thioredoxin 1
MREAALIVFLSLLTVAAGCAESSEEASSGDASTVADAGTGGEAGGGHVETITDATFDSSVSKGVVLVDFWGPRCPPCLELAPTIHRLAGKFAGRAIIGKVNVEEHGRKAAQFGIRYIPTIMVFKDGRMVERVVGLQSEETLTQLMEKHLSQ